MTSLLLKFIQKKCTPEEIKKVSEWIDKSPRNKARFLELQTLWNGIEIVSAMSTEKPDRESVDKIMQLIRKQNNTRIYRRVLFSFSAAAAVVFLFLMLHTPIVQKTEPADITNINYGSILSAAPKTNNIEIRTDNGEIISLQDTSAVINYKENGEMIINNETIRVSSPEESVLNTIHVPYGKRSKIYLSDGSTVHLNSGSSFVYPSVFNLDKREVYLEGEAFFEIERDEGKTFIVKTPFKTTEVSGTSFNILSDKETQLFETVLVSGSITVGNGKEKIELKPAQMYKYNVETKAETLQTVDTYKYIAWINGLIYFEQEPLSHVLRKLEKIYNVRITITNESLFAHRISGDLNLKDSASETMNVIMQMLIPDYVQETTTLYHLQ